MLVGAPLAAYIPLAALAGVLAVVAWNMAEKHEFATLIRASRGDAVVLPGRRSCSSCSATSPRASSSASASARSSSCTAWRKPSRSNGPLPGLEDDRADVANGDGRAPYDSALATDPDVVVYRISGAFFFGAAASVAAALDRIGEHPKAYVVDFSAVPLIDSTAAATMAGFVRKAQRHRAAVYVAGARPPVRRVLLTHAVRPPQVRFKASLADAVAAARRESKGAAESASPAGTAQLRGKAPTD